MSSLKHDGPHPEVRTRRRRRLGMIVMAALLLLVAVGLVYYSIDWRDARGDRRDQSSGGYLKTRQAFLEDIEAARLDAAYQSTTPSFRSRVSRAAFEERVGDYLAFQRRPGMQGVAGHASGPTAGDHRGPNRMTITDTLEDGEGNRVLMSITVMYEDSILYRRPPPLRVGEFTVEEVLPHNPGP